MPELRTGTIADAPAMARLLRVGFESYRKWAPAGWEPPPDQHDPAFRMLLADPDVWSAVAVQESNAIGFVLFNPATTEHYGGERVPGIAHLRTLFVDPRHWRQGVGRALLDRAAAEMRSRGYARGRLWTPTANVASRRLYEHAGWSSAGEEHDPRIGLDLTIYELEL